MSTKGGGKGTPSYKQVVVDRGKEPRGVFFKPPTIGTLGSDPGMGQERDKGKSECMEDEARETQNETQDTTKANWGEGHNPCKPTSTLIHKVVSQDP
jgi:hypothetical protein